ASWIGLRVERRAARALPRERSPGRSHADDACCSHRARLGPSARIVTLRRCVLGGVNGYTPLAGIVVGVWLTPVAPRRTSSRSLLAPSARQARRPSVAPSRGAATSFRSTGCEAWPSFW